MSLKRSGVIINAGKEKELDKMIWQKWLVEIQKMDKDNFIPFEEYKKMMTKPVSLNTGENGKQPGKNIIDMDKLRKNADRIRKKLDPKNDLHLKKGKKKKRMIKE